MLMHGGWSPKVFFDPVPKCSTRFSNIFFRADYVWAFEFVDNPTFLQIIVFIFACNKEGFYSVCAFEMHLYSFVSTCPFELLTYSLYAWNHYGNVFVVVVVSLLG